MRISRMKVFGSLPIRPEIPVPIEMPVLRMVGWWGLRVLLEASDKFARPAIHPNHGGVPPVSADTHVRIEPFVAIRAVCAGLFEQREILLVTIDWKAACRWNVVNQPLLRNTPMIVHGE